MYTAEQKPWELLGSRKLLMAVLGGGGEREGAKSGGFGKGQRCGNEAWRKGQKEQRMKDTEEKGVTKGEGRKRSKWGDGQTMINYCSLNVSHHGCIIIIFQAQVSCEWIRGRVSDFSVVDLSLAISDPLAPRDMLTNVLTRCLCHSGHLTQEIGHQHQSKRPDHKWSVS